MLAVALGAAVSAPASAVTARHAAVAPATVPVAAPASNGRCISDEGADPKNAPTFRTVPASAGAQSASADSAAPRMNLLTMVRSAIRRSNAVGAAKLDRKSVV